MGSHPPDSGGGYSFQADLLAAFMSIAGESGHEFVVFSSAEHAADTRRLGQARNVAVAEIPAQTRFDRLQAMLHRDFAFLRMKWRRAGALQRLAARQGIEYMWFLGSDCHLLDIPYCAVVWDLQHRTLPWFPEVSHRGEWDAREAANAWFLRRAAAVITGTQTGADEIARFYQVQPGLIRILRHPTPAFALAAGADDSAPVLAKYGIDRPYLIYPAQFWAHKNHVNLLHGLHELRAIHGQAVQLVLLGGDKGNRAYCEQVAAGLGLSDALRMPGFIPRQDLIALYQGAAALAYVSFGGPENLPPLEAFAIGCPVVAADIPGAREQLGDCALYVDPAKPAEIASACKRLFDDGALRERLIAAGRVRAAAWTGVDFVRGVFRMLDDFEPIRRTWWRAP